MLATLQREFQQKYSWIKSLRLHPDDEAAFAASSAPEGDVAPEQEQQDPRRLRVEVVVDAYRVQRNAALLDELGYWAQQHGLSLEPYILTEREATQLRALGAADDPTPLTLMRAYRQSPDYPKNAHRHVNRVLSELRRVIHDLGQEFPTSGLHAWNVGLHLQSLYHHITAWGLAIFDKPTTDPADDWATFLELYRSYHPALHRDECTHYHTHLQAFLTRQQQLTSLTPRTFGDNDEEIEQLLLPLEYAVKAIRACAKQTLVRPEEVERRVALIWWMIMTGSILGICGLLALHFVNQPTIFASVSLPKSGSPGGIVGTYYKGQKFGKKLGTRVERKLDFRWRRSPMRGVPADYFSVEWKGFFFTDKQGKHKICSRHDDGLRLYIGKQRLIDDWRGGWARDRCKDVFLQKGWHPLKVEFFEKRKVAEVHISLQKPGEKKPQRLRAKHYCCKPKHKPRKRSRKRKPRKRKAKARRRSPRRARIIKLKPRRARIIKARTRKVVLHRVKARKAASRKAAPRKAAPRKAAPRKAAPTTKKARKAQPLKLKLLKPTLRK